MNAVKVPQRTLHQVIGGMVLAATLVLVAAMAAWLMHHSPAHGGAFEGPCTYQTDSPADPVASLALTDYGPPVQVHYLIVEERDGTGRVINANRVDVGVTVGSNETRVFTAPSISGAATCELVNWG